MAGKQETMIDEIISDEFFSLGTIEIQYWKREFINGRPKHIFEQSLTKTMRFSLQGADPLKIQREGFSDLADNEFFILYLKEELPIYQAEGRYFKIIVDGNEYILRRARPWIAYNMYWISRAAKTLNPF